jgi:hypothetical protein
MRAMCRAVPLLLLLAACGAGQKPAPDMPVPAPFGVSGAGVGQPHLADRCVARLAEDSGSPQSDIRPGGLTTTQSGNLVALSLRGTPYRCTADPGGYILGVTPEYPTPNSAAPT